MAISLYDATVGTYQQILTSVEGVLAKGRAHCEEAGIDLNDVVETRLIDDMLPFRFQVISVAHHSLGALKGVEAGVFGPPTMNAMNPKAGADSQRVPTLTTSAPSCGGDRCARPPGRRPRASDPRRRLSR